MRFLMVTMMFVASSIAGAQVKNFNGLIKEASVSERILRMKLLRSLQNTETAIASVEKREQLKRSYVAPDYPIRLSKQR